MIKFLKENGFPMTIFIDSSEFEELENEFNGYKTTITDENGNLIWKFEHKDLRDRIHWASGFFCALRMKNVCINNEEKYVVYENQGIRYMSIYTDDDNLTDSKDNIKIIAKNVSQPVAYTIIHRNEENVAKKNTEAFLNDLPKELKNKISKDGQSGNKRDL
jgi:hypothetical protein